MRLRLYLWQHLTDVPAVLHTAVVVFAVSDDVEFPGKRIEISGNEWPILRSEGLRGSGISELAHPLKSHLRELQSCRSR
jgi:hypothetical protein